MRKFPLMAAVLLGLLSVVSLNMGVAHADKKKPPQPSESVSLNFTKIMVTYQLEGPAGPTVEVNGQLHVVSQTFIADDGMPVAFTLQGNLANTSALSMNGAQSFQAVGAQDGVPAECAQFCPPRFWTFLFRLIPKGGPGASLLFTLNVRTQYDADGNLTSACIVGQAGCEEIVLQ